MLMTILKGDLAKKQSIALIRIFRAMKEYIIETQGLVSQRDVLRFSLQTNENTEAIRRLQSWLGDQQKIVARTTYMGTVTDPFLIPIHSRS